MELRNPLTVALADGQYLRYLHDVTCLSTDSVGDPVCIRGDRVNGKWRTEKANPYDDTKMPAIGILISKSTPTVGVVQVFGPVEGIFTGLNYLKPSYIVGPAGIQLTAPPTGPGGFAWVQHLGKAVASDILFLFGTITMLKKK
jgi:hypothetical protein